MKRKINITMTILLIVLIEILGLCTFDRIWKDPGRTAVYKKVREESVSIRPEISTKKVEDYLLKNGYAVLDHDVLTENGLPEYSEGFYNDEENTVCYLLSAPDEATAKACQAAVVSNWTKENRPVTTENESRHESTISFSTETSAGLSSWYHSFVLIAISRDGKQIEQLRKDETDLGFIYEKDNFTKE